jgi:hypothetical protein
MPSFPRFVYQHARFIADKSIEVAVRPRKGSAAVCSRCHLPAPGYDQLAERRFEFIPLWGFLVFLLYAMRRVELGAATVTAEALRTSWDKVFERAQVSDIGVSDRSRHQPSTLGRKRG